MGTQVSFGGHRISHNQESNSVFIQPSEEKIEAIRNLEEPKSKQEVQSLVGFLSQMSSFIPEVKTVCPNIKRQTSKFSIFQWGPEEKKKLGEIKKKLERIILITPIHTNLPLVIHCDASGDGLGWILTQMEDPDSNVDEYYKKKQTVIEMGSASLTEAQRRYSPI